MEYLGDAVLNFIVTEWLFNQNNDSDEGFLSIKRSELVNKKDLLKISNQLSLIDYIIIGNSIKITDTKTINNILSDVVESIIGAIFIDGGMRNVKKFITKHLLLNITKLQLNNKNYKGLLIEACHKLSYKEPSFTHVRILKEKQNKFQAKLIINKILYKGISSTKKAAESKAAKKALVDLNKKKINHVP